MKILLQLALILLLALGGFLAGGLIGARSVPPDAAFAAGATVFMSGVIGSIAGVIVAAFVVSGLSLRNQRLVFVGALLLVSLVVVAMAAGWVGGR